MRIALRTGAGRGAYELAGRQGNLSASDLFGREILYELTPGIVIPGRSVAALRQGKARIALDDATRSKTTHVYWLLSAVLLLPKPKRELKATHGKQLLKSYSMTAIKIDVARLSPGDAVLRPTDLLLENADGQRAEMDFTKRMLRVIRVWEAAQRHDTPLAGLVRKWSDAIRATDPDYKAIERSAQEILDVLHTGEDALALIEEKLEIAQPEEEASNNYLSSISLPQADFGLDDDISPEEALIHRIKVWRQQAERGSIGRKFSRAVSSAYDYRCLFTGQRLPRLEIADSPGVDSAHILPWSTHDLDSVRNGICLNKQCHWAFDQGILRLGYDTAANTYTIDVPKIARQAALKASFDMEYFNSMIGPIPEARLPRSRANWPSPRYIGELNRCLATTGGSQSSAG
jgi:hypothetical protein